MYSHHGVLPHYYFRPRPAEGESSHDEITHAVLDPLKVLFTAIGQNRLSLVSAVLLVIALFNDIM